MPSRRVKASSARPSQPQVEGRADDASSLTSNTVAQFVSVFGGRPIHKKPNRLPIRCSSSLSEKR
jgi:hypothetical protein